MSARMSATAARQLAGAGRDNADVLDRVIDRFVPDEEDRRDALDRVARLTGAAVAAYVVARILLDGPIPILAPLTALLVVQVTFVGSLKSGVQRVASVVAGVLIATGFSMWVGFTWWSLGLLIAASLVLGQFLRLGDHLLEVPISAMIVLGAGAAEATALGRIIETLIGALVGVAVNIVVPPRVQVKDAATAVEELATDMASLVDRTAIQVRAGLTPDRANLLADQAARITDQVIEVDREVDEAEESRQLNPRALGTTLETAASLRSGLDVLEHTAVALRALYRAIAARVSRRGGEAGYSEDARLALGQLLTDLASALRAFGRLIRAEVDGDAVPIASELTQMLEALREARVRLTELLLANPNASDSSWEIHGALLTSVERVLQELDIEERAKQRKRLLESVPPRTTPELAVDTLKSATRQVATAPVRRVSQSRRLRRLRRWQRRR
jgi:CRISPR/Cas system CSM-associated protein Csm2 small subunit